MGLKLSVPKTLLQAIIHFADDQNCLAFMVAVRWPNGICCPRCGDDRDRFVTALGMVEGKRLTYEELTRSYNAYYDVVLPL